MPYRITYACEVSWVPPGRGLGQDNIAAGPNFAGGPAQVIEFFSTAIPNSTTFLSGDVTNLLATMTTDLSTQMNANLARIQAFATGGG